MSDYQLSNSFLTMTVSSHGAELCRVTGADGTEYLWNADPAYWKRHSPVLFPVVGNYKNKQFTYQGKSWPMGQHGFARDLEFTLCSQTDTGLSFLLTSNEETRALYPMDFDLTISYELKENQIFVSWKVENPGADPLFFSIGAHPAFFCPIDGQGVQTDYSIDLHTDASEVLCGVLTQEGTLSSETVSLPLEQGRLKLESHTFDRDALIIEHTAIRKLTLCLPDHRPYVRMDFSAPLFGIWSPAGKQAPFVCLEPWYGRADREDFQGDLTKREYSIRLNAREDWHASYSMAFFPVK